MALSLSLRAVLAAFFVTLVCGCVRIYNDRPDDSGSPTSPSPNPGPGPGNGGLNFNLTGDWEGKWLYNIKITLHIVQTGSSFSGTAVEQTGTLFSRGPVQSLAVHPENVVMRITLYPDGDDSIYREYTVNALLLNNYTEMKGSTVSGTQDFDVFKK